MVLVGAFFSFIFTCFNSTQENFIVTVSKSNLRVEPYESNYSEIKERRALLGILNLTSGHLDDWFFFRFRFKYGKQLLINCI